MRRRDWIKLSGLATGALATNSLFSDENRKGGKSPRQGVSHQEDEILFEQKLSVRYNVDVFIAGGGPAGVAAAFAARTQGASVFLAEGHTCLGGMGTAGRVPVFMQVSDGVHLLCDGFGRRVLELLQKEKNMKGPGTDIEALKRTYDSLLSEVDANFTFYTQLIAVQVSKGHLDYVVCASPSGNFAVRANVYIDATGNGDLATWSGAEYQKGDSAGIMMPGTLCSLWGGIDWDKWRKVRPDIHQPEGYRLKEAFAAGVFTIQDEHLTGMHPLGDSFAGGNIGHTFSVDGTDERSLTKALLWGRKSMKEYARYYREYIDGFQNAQLLDTGSLLGIRETRRIIGDHVLSIDEYKKRAIFDDEIGRYSYPIDIHPMRTGADTYKQHRKEFDQKYKYNKGESYGIPYRTLTPKGFENLLVAGRCISSDHLVHGSVRVMPACFITGQAAGIAAVLAAKSDRSVHDIPVDELQMKLKKFGAFLPNYKG
ncbi:MAG: FAD-dependent oxidoreductase [Thermoguttaceae bacterium]|nr:FAD-dependent oxidoreductase [Thermoguttaceae bacterium]